MNFSVEEENLICMYHTSDRRRTMARMLAALPDMDTEMRQLAKRHHWVAVSGCFYFNLPVFFLQ